MVLTSYSETNTSFSFDSEKVSRGVFINYHVENGIGNRKQQGQRNQANTNKQEHSKLEEVPLTYVQHLKSCIHMVLLHNNYLGQFECL